MKCLKCKEVGRLTSIISGQEAWACPCGNTWKFTPGVEFLKSRIQFMSDCERVLVDTALNVPYGEASDMMKGILDAHENI